VSTDAMSNETHFECIQLLEEAQARLVNAIHAHDLIELADSVSALIECNKLILSHLRQE